MFNCPEMVCWIWNEKGHTKSERKKRAYGLPTPSEPGPGSSATPAASQPTIIERPKAGASAVAGGRPRSKSGFKIKGKAKALRNNRPTGQLARIIPKTEFTGSYADAVVSTSASQGQSTSKRPADDEPASPATKLLKTYNDFNAKLAFNKQRFEDLAVEEQDLKKDFELKLKDLEARRAAVLADQEKELKLRQATEKAEEFFRPALVPFIYLSCPILVQGRTTAVFYILSHVKVEQTVILFPSISRELSLSTTVFPTSWKWRDICQAPG